jgi:hypothetical protein
MSRQNNAERLQSRYRDNGNQLDIRFRPRQASDGGLSHASASRETSSILTTKRSTIRPVEVKSSSHVSITPPLGAACESLGSNKVVWTVDAHRDGLSRSGFPRKTDTVNARMRQSVPPGIKASIPLMSQHDDAGAIASVVDDFAAAVGRRRSFDQTARDASVNTSVNRMSRNMNINRELLAVDRFATGENLVPIHTLAGKPQHSPRLEPSSSISSTVSVVDSAGLGTDLSPRATNVPLSRSTSEQASRTLVQTPSSLRPASDRPRLSNERNVKKTIFDTISIEFNLNAPVKLLSYGTETKERLTCDVMASAGTTPSSSSLKQTSKCDTGDFPSTYPDNVAVSFESHPLKKSMQSMHSSEISFRSSAQTRDCELIPACQRLSTSERDEGSYSPGVIESECQLAFPGSFPNKRFQESFGSAESHDEYESTYERCLGSSHCSIANQSCYRPLLPEQNTRKHSISSNNSNSAGEQASRYSLSIRPADESRPSDASDGKHGASLDSETNDNESEQDRRYSLSSTPTAERRPSDASDGKQDAPLYSDTSDNESEQDRRYSLPSQPTAEPRPSDAGDGKHEALLDSDTNENETDHARRYSLPSKPTVERRPSDASDGKQDAPFDSDTSDNESEQDRRYSLPSQPTVERRPSDASDGKHESPLDSDTSDNESEQDRRYSLQSKPTAEPRPSDASDDKHEAPLDSDTSDNESDHARRYSLPSKPTVERRPSDASDGKHESPLDSDTSDNESEQDRRYSLQSKPTAERRPSDASDGKHEAPLDSDTSDNESEQDRRYSLPSTPTADPPPLNANENLSRLSMNRQSEGSCSGDACSESDIKLQCERLSANSCEQEFCHSTMSAYKSELEPRDLSISMSDDTIGCSNVSNSVYLKGFQQSLASKNTLVLGSEYSSTKTHQGKSGNSFVNGSECEHHEVSDGDTLTRRNDDNREFELFLAKRHKESSFRSDMGDSECGLVSQSLSASEEDLTSVRPAVERNEPESVPRLLSANERQVGSCNSALSDRESEPAYEYVSTKTSQIETSSVTVVTLIDGSIEHVPRCSALNEQRESSYSLAANCSKPESVCEHSLEISQEGATNCFQCNQMTDLHTCVPYLWLVRRNGFWFTMHNNREIEEAFCNARSVLMTKQLDVRLFGFLLCLAFCLR